jgi:erythronate-4-phosphate dehydrogenase
MKEDMKLKILADENIPQLDIWFSPLGDVRKVSGRELTVQQIGDANVLLVRSVTQVNEALLKNTGVQFVGTATIGIDHLDIAWLESQGIRWVSAPGSNATSVVEYVLAALCEVDDVFERLLDGAVVGIVGGGNVGSRLYHRLNALNISAQVFDPFLTEQSALPLVDWQQILKADVLCLHTPLTRAGDHPTYHLFDEKTLARLSDHALVLNAGRGAVVDNTALLNWLLQKNTRNAVLDVWENEPGIDGELFAKVRVGTPHIAGYSLDGKYAGSWQLYQSLAAWLQNAYGVNASAIKQNDTEKLALEIIDSSSRADLIRQVMKTVYPIQNDYQNLAAVMQLPDELQRRAGFDRLRRQYPVRREIAAHRIANQQDISPNNLRILAALGFAV